MQRDRGAASIHLEGISNRNMKEHLMLGSLWFRWLAERGAEAASDGWSVASALQAQGRSCLHSIAFHWRHSLLGSHSCQESYPTMTELYCRNHSS